MDRNATIKKILRLTALFGILALVNAGTIFAADNRESLSTTDARPENTTEPVERRSTANRKPILAKRLVNTAQTNAAQCKDYCPFVNGRPTSVSIPTK